MTQCNKCGKELERLQRCSQCASVYYCSRECQKDHWKTHKIECATLANKRAQEASPEEQGRTNFTNKASKHLEYAPDKPFTRLDNGTWLHGRPERDVYKLLIDAFRLRCDDDMKFGVAVIWRTGTIYTGAKDSSSAFINFLDILEGQHKRLLPDWWTSEKRLACMELGEDASSRWSLSKRAGKQEIIDAYGEPSNMAMQLRMFVEAVVGVGPDGNNGRGMRLMMMQQESKSGAKMAMETLNMAPFLDKFLSK
jgi:mitochondrial splicing suppressor protein 51